MIRDTSFTGARACGVVRRASPRKRLRDTPETDYTASIDSRRAANDYVSRPEKGGAASASPRWPTAAQRRKVRTRPPLRKRRRKLRSTLNSFRYSFLELSPHTSELPHASETPQVRRSSVRAHRRAFDSTTRTDASPPPPPLVAARDLRPERRVSHDSRPRSGSEPFSVDDPGRISRRSARD